MLPSSTSISLYCHFSRVSGREGDKNAWPTHHPKQVPRKLHRLHSGNLPLIVLSSAVKQAAPLPRSWKEKQKSNPNHSRNSVLPFWNPNIGLNFDVC